MRAESVDHAELNRLLKLATLALENLDLSGANDALKQASATTLKEETGTRSDRLLGSQGRTIGTDTISAYETETRIGDENGISN